MSFPPSQWFFLRGLIRESNHWQGFPEKFQKRFPQAQIVLLDLPGAGKLRQLDCPSRIELIVPILREEFLRQKQAQLPSYIFTLSLGAMCATEWIQKYPQDFSGAVFANTSFGSLSKFYERMRMQNLLNILQIVFCSPLTREKNILQITSNNFTHNSELAAEWAQLPSMAFGNKIRQLMAARAFEGPLLSPMENILLLQSANDRLINPNCMEQIHKAWGRPIFRHPTAGHDLTLDEPEWVLDRINDHFQKNLSVV